MALHVEIQASSETFIQYKALVNSDWNNSTLRKVLDLLSSVMTAGRTANEASTEWVETLRKLPQHKSGSTIHPDLIKLLKTIASVWSNPHIPRIEGDIVSGKSQAVVQTRATIVYLFLEPICEVTGETGFFQDLQSLLYLNAVHCLIPELKKRTDSKTPLVALLNALHVHAFLIWRDDPSHMFYLLAALMGQLVLQR